MNNPETFLLAILSVLLPTEEKVQIEVVHLNDRAVLLILDPTTTRGRAIVMGKGGATINALRRLLQAAAYRWQLAIINIELKGDTAREPEAPRST